MAHYVCSIATPLSAEEAFDRIADFTTVEQWDPGVSSAVMTYGEKPGVGTIYAVVANGVSLEYETLEYDRPNRTVLEASNAWMTSHDVIGVVPNDTGSVLTYDATVTLHGPLGLFDPVFSLMFKRIGDKAAQGLAEQLEGQRLSR